VPTRPDPAATSSAARNTSKTRSDASLLVVFVRPSAEMPARPEASYDEGRDGHPLLVELLVMTSRLALDP
jgi:hypothetical protein